MDKELISWIKDIPKIELHCHLEGCVTPAILQMLVNRYEPKNELAISIKACEDLYNFHSFSGFLDAFSTMYQFIRAPADIALIIENIMPAMQNHLYIEFLYSPDPLISRGYSVPEIFDTLQTAFTTSNTTTEIGIVLDFVRNNGPETILQFMKQITKYLPEYHSLIRGISLGGDEVRFPAKLFKQVFSQARKSGLHTTVHAGEAVGSESIWDAIFTLKTDRIGHGLTAITSPDLLRHLRATQTHIEISPTSNIRTGLVADSDLSNHPIGTYHTKGLNLSINTDDPGFFATTIENELLTVAQTFNFSRHDLEQILLNTAMASFQPNIKRLALADRLRTYFASS